MSSCKCLKQDEERMTEEDQNESTSAPVEILGEFLSSVMTQDYENALKHCLTILKYEPNNKTAQEFYPLLEKKLKLEVERRECRYSWEADDDEYSTVSEDSSDHFSSAKSGDSDSFMSSDEDSEEITGMSSEKGCNEVIKKSDVGEKNIFFHNIE